MVLGISGFLLIPLYVRYMTPAEYGVFSTVNALILVVGMVVQWGLPSAVTRFYYIERDKGQERSYLGAVWLRQILYSGVLTLALVPFMGPVWAYFFPRIPFYPYALLTGISCFSSFSAVIFSIWLRIQERPLQFVLLQAFNAAVNLILVLYWLIAAHKGAIGVVQATTITNVIIALVSFALLGRSLRWGLRHEGMSESFRYGFWIMLGTVGYFATNRAQIFILQYFGDMATVGAFNLAIQISSGIFLISGSFSKAWQPAVYAAPTEAEAAQIIGSTSRYYAAIIVYLSLALALFAPEIIRIIAPPAYHGLAPTLRLVITATLIYSLASIPAGALLYMKLPRITQTVILFSAGINIGLCILLLPHWKIEGAAISMIAANCVFTGMTYALAQKHLAVSYDWGKLSIIALTSVAIFLAAAWGEAALTPLAIVVFKLILLSLFPLALCNTGVFRVNRLTLYPRAVK